MERKQHIAELIDRLLEESMFNVVSAQTALAPELEGMRIYDAPLVGFADAGDPLFESFRSPEVIGAHYRTPGDWLAGAASVISFFLPFTRQVREANRQDFVWPANEWLHGRIEGQKVINGIMQGLCEELTGEGGRCVAPSLDPGFRVNSDPSPDDPSRNYSYSSNWSERHAAYAAGLGTFSLTRGLITKRGMAGRFGSVVTDLALEADVRPYDEPFAYCTRCGLCAKHCPVGAITIAGGKRNLECSLFMDETQARLSPYYGCGKCQVAVPCESEIPHGARLRDSIAT